jgi:hypothetical protein
MSIFDIFKKKSVPGVVHTIEAVSPVIQGGGVVKLGIGKWVVCQEKVGIIADTRGYPIVSVHYVDSEGCTILEVSVPIDSVRIAKFLEIPEARRPTDAAYAAAYLGYV